MPTDRERTAGDLSRRQWLRLAAVGGLAGTPGCNLLGGETADPAGATAATGTTVTTAPTTTDGLSAELDRLRRLDRAIGAVVTADGFEGEESRQRAVERLRARVAELGELVGSIAAHSEVRPTVEEERLRVTAGDRSVRLTPAGSAATVTVAIAGHLRRAGALDEARQHRVIGRLLGSIPPGTLVGGPTPAALEYVWLEQFDVNQEARAQRRESVTRSAIENARTALRTELDRAVPVSPARPAVTALLGLEVGLLLATSGDPADRGLLVALLSFVAADTSWPQFHRDARNTGHRDAPPAAATPAWETGLDVRVSFQRGTRGTGTAGRQLLYVAGAGEEPRLAALDSASGSEVWSEPFPGERWLTTPAIDEETVYLGSYGGTVYALDRYTRAEQWTYDTGDVLWASPTIADGTVYVGGRDRRVHALDAASGERRWAVDTEWEVSAGTAVADGIVYVADGDDNVYALAADSGEERWRFEGSNYIEGAPTVADGTVYVGKDRVHALDAATGKQRWAFESPNLFSTSPAVAGDTVYAATTLWPSDIRETGVSPALYAIDTADGSERWSLETDAEVFSAPVVAGGTVYLGADDGTVRAVAAADGRERWRFEADTGVAAAPAADDRMVYVASRSGRVYAFPTE